MDSTVIKSLHWITFKKLRSFDLIKLLITGNKLHGIAA